MKHKNKHYGRGENRYFRQNKRDMHTEKDAINNIPEEEEKLENEGVPEEEVAPEEVEIVEGEAETAEDLEQKLQQTEEALAKEKKEYMFLMAEFDNFRKRTIKEKSEIIKNAGENVLKGLLPIIDDFERGLKASENSEDAAGIREGMQLIYNKLVKYLATFGVKEFDPDDKVFDVDKHEAISVVPVPDEEAKGKILDTVEKGYMINDKVLRHAKVVVGQ